MIVLTGPSATGKTDTALHLMKEHGLKKVVTCTTRSPRVGEKDGVDYHFLTVEQFKEGLAKGEFLEHAEYNGNLYGTRKKDIADDMVSCVEPQGAHSYRKALGDTMFCCYLDASEETRYQRMVGTRHDGEKAARERIERDRLVYADNGADAKSVADAVVDTDGLTDEEEAEKVWVAYQEWKKKKAA